jgi:hypothetical protein
VQCIIPEDEPKKEFWFRPESPIWPVRGDFCYSELFDKLQALGPNRLQRECPIVLQHPSLSSDIVIEWMPNCLMCLHIFDQTDSTFEQRLIGDTAFCSSCFREIMSETYDEDLPFNLSVLGILRS